LSFPVSHKGCTMNFIGIDLHKKTITIEAQNQERRFVSRQTLACSDPRKIVRVFESLRPFQAVMEATALRVAVEPAGALGRALALGQSAQVADHRREQAQERQAGCPCAGGVLVLDMIPPAYRPTPRQREHRRLVRQREYLTRRSTSVRNKIRRVVTDYNAD